MTVGDMIAQTRSLNRGQYTDAQLIQWLNEIDERIFHEVICTHEGAGTWNPYLGMADELIVPNAYGSLYRHWIDSQIYLSNGETTRYNNAAALYNTVLMEFANWYNRTHKPLRRNITF